MINSILYYIIFTSLILAFACRLMSRWRKKDYIILKFDKIHCKKIYNINYIDNMIGSSIILYSKVHLPKKRAWWHIKKTIYVT